MENVWKYGIWVISFLSGLFGMKYAIDVGLIPPRSGSITDWQIAIIAATIPTILYPVRGYIEERNIKKQIKMVIKSELEVLRNTIMGLSEKEPSKDGFYDFDFNDPIYFELPLDITYYDDVSVESISKTFNSEQLKLLQLTYRSILFFNRNVYRRYGRVRVSNVLYEKLRNQLDELFKTFGW